MGWVRLSDDFYDNDKTGEISPVAVALWVASIAFCNRNLTDGFITKVKAHSLLDCTGIVIGVSPGTLIMDDAPTDCTEEAVNELLKVGAWHESGHNCKSCFKQQMGAGHDPDPGPRKYLVHDYLDFQRSKEQIRADQAATAERVAKWRERQKKSASTSVGNGVSTSPPTPTPTPTPTPSSSSSGDVEKKSLACVGAETSAVAKAPAQSKRGTRLPGKDGDGWMPLDRTVGQIREEFPWATNEDLASQHRSFLDWAYGSASRNAVKLDWEATWRNWMRRELRKPAYQNRAGAPGREGPADRKIRLIDEMGIHAEGE